jgi:NB-ARC domain
LPGDMANFVGRADLVGEILAALTPSGSVVPPVILSGPPGVGKTALAVHVAHQLRPVFPDGQLYVNLRGFSQSPPVSAADALAQFLGALGMAADQLPASVDQRSTLFRSLLAERRVLLVLDNASNAEQIRPLLPGHLGCAVIVTSRDMLSGLSAVNDARRIPVGPVTEQEAVSILTTFLDTRVAEEPAAAVDMAAACGNLPLALRIGAANLAAMPGQPISSYVSQLRSEDRLSALAVQGDDIAAVGRAFDLSYAALSVELARTFRYLGLIPMPTRSPTSRRSNCRRLGRCCTGWRPRT